MTLRTLRDAVATAASAPLGVVPGGLYDRALFLESRGKATLFVPAPHSAHPAGGRPCRGLTSGRIRGAHPLRRPRRHRPQLRGSGKIREREPDQPPGADPRTLPRRHALGSNNVHRHRDLLADLQHHPTARMTAVLGQSYPERYVTQTPSVRATSTPSGGTGPPRPPQRPREMNLIPEVSGILICSRPREPTHFVDSRTVLLSLAAGFKRGSDFDVAPPKSGQGG